MDNVIVLKCITFVKWGAISRTSLSLPIIGPILYCCLHQITSQGGLKQTMLYLYLLGYTSYS